MKPRLFLVLPVLFFASAATARAEVGDASIATWFRGATSAYTLSYDDNNSDHFNYFGPALDERGLKGTFFINPSYTGMASWQWYHDDYANLALSGHELGSHTLTHKSVIPNDPQYPDNCMESLAELEEDCIEAKSVLESLVPGTETVSFCYPMGRDDAASREVIARHFLSARDVRSHFVSPDGHYTPNPASPPDMYALGCFVTAGSGGAATPSFVGYEESVVAFTAYIEDTLSAGGWAIEYRHNLWGTNEAAYWEHLDELQILAEEGAIWNGTQGEVTKYIYSRDAAEISLMDVRPDAITFTVDDGLDDAVFDIPVTVDLQIPADWAASEYTILHGTTPVPGRTVWNGEAAFLSFDVLADGQSITIAPTLPAVPEPGVGVLLGVMLISFGTRRASRRGV